MVSIVTDDDAFSPDGGTICDLEKTFYDLRNPVNASVQRASSKWYKQGIKISGYHIYKDLFPEIESKFKFIIQNKKLQIDLNSIKAESLKHCLGSAINCSETLRVLSSCFLATKQAGDLTEVIIATFLEQLLQALSSLFGRNAYKKCFVWKNKLGIEFYTTYTSICNKGYSVQWSLLFTPLSPPLSGATMEPHHHLSAKSPEQDNLLSQQRKRSILPDSSSSNMCRRLGCRILSVTMTTDTVMPSQPKACMCSPTKDTTMLPCTEGPTRRTSLMLSRKPLLLEDNHVVQSVVNKYSNCTNTTNNSMNNSVSTSCRQSSSHSQFSRSRSILSVNSSHLQSNRRKCNVRRNNSGSSPSNYLSNCSRSVHGDNNRTINSDAESSVTCCLSLPSTNDGNNYPLLPPPPHATVPAPHLQPRRWSLSSPSRSKDTATSEAVLASNSPNSPSSADRCDATTLSSCTLLCGPSKRVAANTCIRRRRSGGHHRPLPSARSFDHSRDLTSHRCDLRISSEGGQLEPESCVMDTTAKTYADGTSTAASLLPVPPYTGSSNSGTMGNSSFRVPVESVLTSTESASILNSALVQSSLPRREEPCGGELHRVPSPQASPLASQPRPSVHPSAPRLRQAQDLASSEQVQVAAAQSSSARHRRLSKRPRKCHPLVGLWNLLTQSTSTSSTNCRDGMTSSKLVSHLWTGLLSLLLLVTVLPNVAECCSSRSTPRPRPSSPTLRPNITFQTYACPPAYAAWYCLNGATCFTVKIGESILYNCECAEGYMGQRCEFKDLDGSYLPTREKVLLETASIAGGATVVIVLVFFVIFSMFLVRNRDKDNRDLDGMSRINININSGAASLWPANSGGNDQSPSYSQHTSHTFVTSPSGALATSPHTTTISTPPHHLHRDSQQSCPFTGVATDTVDGKCFAAELEGGTMVVEDGMKRRGDAPTSVAAGESFYGVPARVVRTVTTITDLASVYTHPRQEVHQVEVLQQVNVLKVDQSKACYNATFVRPSSNASTTALFRGPMWREVSAGTNPGNTMSSAPLSWQQFKATSWLSSSPPPPSKTQDRLSVMPQRNASPISVSDDKVTLDLAPQLRHVVVPLSEQLSRVTHGTVTLAMASHAADLQHQPSNLILANSKMPFDVAAEINSRSSLGGNDSDTIVDMTNDCCANGEREAHNSSTVHCTSNDIQDNNSATGVVNQGFDCGEDIINRSYSGHNDC